MIRWVPWVALLLPAPVLAHGIEPPAAIQPLFEGGHLRAVGTNYGLLRAASDGSFAWTPEEVLEETVGGSLVITRYALFKGRVYAATTQGLFVTEDSGCQWQEAGIEGYVGDLAVTQGVFIVSVGAPGSKGAVLRSTDATRFEQVRAEPANHLLSDGSRLLLEAGDGALALSKDGGLTWQPLALSGRPVGWRVDEALLLAVPGSESERLAECPPPYAQCTDLGLTHTRILAAAQIGDGVLVLGSDGRLTGAGSAEPPATAACLERRGAELWLCQSVVAANHHLLHTMDLRSWQGAVPFAAVRPAACPKGSPGARWVEQLWPIMQAAGVGVAPPEDTPPPTGCGCGGPAAIFVLLPLFRCAVPGPRKRQRRRGEGVRPGR
ncbi:MAG: hypothetical protein D6729_02810 [Deltaproteobacteria bacterium]|nr:MAG: hypothetical protein D6729_02810 [Deltaproteobacteria bacterium]